jgi:hypothetical protein
VLMGWLVNGARLLDCKEGDGERECALRVGLASSWWSALEGVPGSSSAVGSLKAVGGVGLLGRLLGGSGLAVLGWVEVCEGALSSQRLLEAAGDGGSFRLVLLGANWSTAVRLPWWSAGAAAVDLVAAPPQERSVRAPTGTWRAT